jgi:hypothetical protein
MDTLDRLESVLIDAVNLADDVYMDTPKSNIAPADELCLEVGHALRALRRMKYAPTDEQVRDEADDRRLAEHLGK